MRSPALFSWRRALLALGLGWVLVLGSVTPHAPTAGHTDSPAGIEIDRSARHPEEPAHLEGSAPEFHPGCTACLLQIHSSAFPIPAALPVPVPGDVLPAAEVRLASKPSTGLGPARAPPVLSLSL